MRFRLRVLCSVLLLQAMLSGQDAAAAPVLQGDASPSPARAGLLAEPAPEDEASPGASAAAQQDPASTADEEATRSRALDEARAAALNPAVVKSSAPRAVAGIDGDSEIDPDLKEAARTALQWAHDAKQLVLPAGAGMEEGIGSGPAWAGEVPPRSVGAGAGGGAEYGWPAQPAPAQGRHIGGGSNLIEEAVELVKEITGHPVTWMLMPVVLFGGAAALVMQYRPQLERRWRHRRAAHRRLGSSDPSRGHRQHRHHRHHHHHHGTSAGTQGPPLPAHRSAKASGRSRGHRSSKPKRIV